MPQVFKGSPKLLDKTLSAYLLTFWQMYPESTLLQYVNELFKASETKEECKKAIEVLLETLKAALSYQVSANKVQLHASRVTYLGCNLEGDKQRSQSQILAILWISTPKAKKQVQEFLSPVRYCGHLGSWSQPSHCILLLMTPCCYKEL